ncbi:MAG: phosphoglycerate dehydrogenase [Pseudomonadota bacterium]
MYRIKTLNQIALRGLERFPRDRYEVAGEFQEPDALILRSHRLASDDLGPSLRAIARAGAGVNNIPVDACSDRGIVVFNTPGANANSVKELVFGMALMAARQLKEAVAFAGSLDPALDAAALNSAVEAEKKAFKGSELAGKTLGVVGLGAIGSRVAEAALAFDMDVLGYDPAISIDAAWRLPSRVQRMENLTTLFNRSDYVTLHVPLLPQTQGLVNNDSLTAFQPGAVLMNFAREPIVDAAALRRALDSGRIGRYIADFPVPDLVGHPRVLTTPHLGASTAEAEENCAVMAADQLRDFLERGNIHNSVNFPAVRLDDATGHRLAVINRNVPGMIGQITSALAKHDINVIDMLNRSREDVAYNLIDCSAPVSAPVVSAVSAIDSVINVRTFAAQSS